MDRVKKWSGWDALFKIGDSSSFKKCKVSNLLVHIAKLNKDLRTPCSGWADKGVSCLEVEASFSELMLFWAHVAITPIHDQNKLYVCNMFKRNQTVELDLAPMDKSEIKWGLIEN